MPLTRTPSIRFIHGVEEIQPSAAPLTAQPVESRTRANRLMSEKHRHATSHGGQRCPGKRVRRVFADDQLSFTLFYCLPQHQPPGRSTAYEWSTAYRHRMNAQPRVEPRYISQLPN